MFRVLLLFLNVSFSGLITSVGEEKADFSSIVYSIVIMWFLVCSHVEDFNARNNCLTATAELLKQRYRYHKLRPFSKFYR